MPSTSPASATTPVSSRSSRSAASSADSPASRLPPGSAHCPEWFRRVAARLVISRQGTSACSSTQTATDAARSPCREIGTRWNPATLAATTALSTAGPATIMPRSALHRRPPRRLPARLGPDGVPESAGHVPLEVPRHDNGILQPSGLPVRLLRLYFYPERTVVHLTLSCIGPGQPAFRS